MSTEERIDEVKGAVKEGVGKVTGDKKLEKEGVKDLAENVKESIEGPIDGVKNIVNKDK